MSHRGVEGEEQWSKNTPLGGASTDGMDAGEDTSQPRLLSPVGEEVSGGGPVVGYVLEASPQ